VHLRRRAGPPAPLSAAERARAEKLLAGDH